MGMLVIYRPHRRASCTSSRQLCILHHCHGYLSMHQTITTQVQSCSGWTVWEDRPAWWMAATQLSFFLREVTCYNAGPPGQTLTQQTSSPSGSWMEVGFGGEFLANGWPYYLATIFDLPRCYWALLNHFQTNQSHCKSRRKKWGLAATDMCPCGRCQKMSHIVNSCPQS